MAALSGTLTRLNLGQLPLARRSNGAAFQRASLTRLCLGMRGRQGLGRTRPGRWCVVPAFLIRFPHRRSTKPARPGCRRLPARQTIMLGESEIAVAGGIESMSRMPYLVDSEDARWGHRMGNFALVDAMYRDGFTCSL